MRRLMGWDDDRSLYLGHSGLNCGRHGRRHFGKGGLQKLRLEPERPGLGFKSNMSLPINQIETIRPTRVNLFRPVAEFVKDRRNLNAEFAYAGSRDKFAFLLVLGGRENDVVFNVALHLPDVAGMRLGD